MLASIASMRAKALLVHDDPGDFAETFRPAVVRDRSITNEAMDTTFGSTGARKNDDLPGSVTPRTGVPNEADMVRAI